MRSCRQKATSSSPTSGGSAEEGSDSADESGSRIPGATPGTAVAAAVNDAVGKKGFKRPLGSKKAGTFLEQNKAIAKGSDGIASMAKAAHKRVKLGEEALKIEKKKAETENMKATMQLFSMEGSCPVLRAKVFKHLQEKALADLPPAEFSADGSALSTPETGGNSPLDTAEKNPSSDDEPEEAAPGEREGGEGADNFYQL